MRIGRIMAADLKSGICTATLIGKSCMVTAGHCASILDLIQFDVPDSTFTGQVRHPAEENVYNVDKGSIVYRDNSIGRDWTVFRVAPNSKTGALPGDLYGHYIVSFDGVSYGDPVRITGYGTDTQKTRNFVQQTSDGLIVSTDRSLSYQVDTTGGNSGSSIILDGTDYVIGIHTHGGCGYGDDSGNFGTDAAQSPDFQKAVNDCLAQE